MGPASERQSRPDMYGPVPGRRIEGVREILCLMHDLATAGFHNADGVCWPPWYVIVYAVIQRSPFPRIRLTFKPTGLHAYGDFPTKSPSLRTDSLSQRFAEDFNQ
jgi:hypothetical protein